MIYLSLIGYGRWGRNYVTAARDAGNAVIQTVVLPPGSATVVPDIPVSHDVEEAAHNADAVVIAAHPKHAASLIERIAPLGKPIMLEKPAGLSLDDALRIHRAAQDDVPFLVAHQHLFGRAYEQLRDMVLERGGCSVDSVGVGPGPVRDYSPLWDYGPHDVAMLLGMDPREPRIISANAEQTERGELWMATLSMSRGVANIHVGNGAEKKERRLTARHGEWSCVVDGNDLVTANGRTTFHELPLTLAVRAFAHAVATGDADWRFGSHWAVRVASILTQCAASSRLQS